MLYNNVTSLYYKCQNIFTNRGTVLKFTAGYINRLRLSPMKLSCHHLLTHKEPDKNYLFELKASFLTRGRLYFP